MDGMKWWPFKFDPYNFTGDDVISVLPDLDERIRPQAEAMLPGWGKYEDSWQRRKWFERMGGHERTKELELEQGDPPQHRGHLSPGGMWEGMADDHFRRKFRELVFSVSAAAPAPKTPPVKRRTRRHHQPTQNELDALERANERRREEGRRRREEKAASS
jgi:hypothetical protein